MPRVARVEGYSRRHRFAGPGAFGPVLRGSRKLRGRFVTVHAVPSAATHARLGIALTKRLVPSSVHRNLVKRLARDTFRRHALKAQPLDCVVALREKFTPELSRPLVEELAGLFDRLLSAPAR